MGEVQDIKDVKKIFIAPAIKSFDHYDFARAKIGCSLKWLVTKAYGTGRANHMVLILLHSRRMHMECFALVY